MLKLRLKKIGRKNQISYRLVVATNKSNRNSASIDTMGYYNTVTKKFVFNTEKITKWLKHGAIPTLTVKHLLNRINIFI